MTCRELEDFIVEKLEKMKDKDGRVALVDSFHIGGYMCEPDRITRLIFPIIEEALD